MTETGVMEGLHRAIAMRLVNEKPHLTGAEFRFLRKGTRPVAGAARAVFRQRRPVGCATGEAGTRAQVGRPFPARHLSRARRRHAQIRDLVDRMSNLDRKDYEHALFEETEQGWMPRAA